jgi:hypothetical protein
MLSNFKKKRVNKSAAATMKKNATIHRAKKAQNQVKRDVIEATAPVESSESESDYSDSSDSEYEEILISNLNKTKIKEDKKEEKKDLPSEPAKLKREETKIQEIPNHANHFTEPKSEPIDIPKPKNKSKSKRVVIKKYYNYKPKSERKRDVIEAKEEVKPEPKPEPKKEDPKPRLNYLGFNTGNIKNDTRQHMTNRIFNW